MIHAVVDTEPARPVDGAMDKRLPRQRMTWRRGAILAAALVLLALAGFKFIQASGVRNFAVDAELLTIHPAKRGIFLDFVPIRGNITPLRTVYLDAIEGGRVEKIFVEPGALVAEGEPILELSNTTLQLDVISREAQVSEQLNSLRNTRLAMEQNRLALKNTLVEVDYHITRLQDLADRRRTLFERGLIARHDYQQTIDELEFYRLRRAVAIESQETDTRMRMDQLQSLEATVRQLEQNLSIARANLDSLVIRAPLAGQLTALDAEIGQSMERGQRLGQVDDVNDFKVNARVDEFYVSRTRAGQSAEFDLSGQRHRLEVSKVYPQIRDGQFEIDLAFTEPPPPELRRGQTLQIRVALGEATEVLLLPRGEFFQDTGGNWAFVLSESGKHAVRKSITLGRRNPDYFEVLEGLEAGDRVVTSTYASYLDMDRITIKQ